MSDAVDASLLNAAFAHHVDAYRAVWHLCAHVHRPTLLVEQVEILRKRFPVPLDAFVEGDAGNVFDALHQFDQFGLSAGPHRRETDAAIPGDHRGDAVTCGWFECVVPGRLAVVVGVNVDEARA